MAELIRKDKLIDWSYREPQYYDSMNDRTDMRDFINGLTTTTAAEIRAKALGVMGMAMKEFYPSCKGAYVDFDVFFHAVMARVAEKMEEGADND